MSGKKPNHPSQRCRERKKAKTEKLYAEAERELRRNQVIRQQLLQSYRMIGMSVPSQSMLLKQSEAFAFVEQRVREHNEKTVVSRNKNPNPNEPSIKSGSDSGPSDDSLDDAETLARRNKMKK